MTEIIRPPKQRASKKSLAFFALMLGLVVLLLIYRYSLIIALASSVLTVIVAVTVLIGANREEESDKRINVLAIIAEYTEISTLRRVESKEQIETRIERIPTYERRVSIEDVFNDKMNRNVAVIGESGSGKTELVYWLIGHLKNLHKVIIQYKNSDRYTELGIPTLYLKDFVPNVFKDKEAFIQAWRVAFPIDVRGITASQFTGILEDLWNRSKSWTTFMKLLDDRIREAERGKGSVTYEALSTLKENAKRLYQTKIANLEIPDDIVVDFEFLNQDAFVFYAEYLLRQLNVEILRNERKNTMIFIDECHLFTRNEQTIIPDIAKLIRATGALLVASQRLSAIKGDIYASCATRFCGRQSTNEDLVEIDKLPPMFKFAVTELRPHEFVDLAASDPHKEINVFRLINPKPDFKPVTVLKLQGEEREQREEIDLDAEILKLVEEPQNIQAMAKMLARKYRQSETPEDREYFRFQLMGKLKKLASSGEIGAEKIENVKFKADGTSQEVEEKIYYARGSHPSGLHDYLVRSCATILQELGIAYELTDKNGTSTADILTEKFVLEIETGLKRSKEAMDQLHERERKYRDEQKETIIVIPNKTTEYKDEYREAITPLQLWRLLASAKEVERGKEKGEVREE